MFYQKVFRYILAVLILTMTALLAACGEENKPVETETEGVVVIGTMNLVNGDLIAQYEKWYETELGMKAKVVNFNSGKEVLTALAADKVDISQVGTSPATLALSNNIDIKVIFIGDIIGTAESLVAKNESNINSVKDLAGKKIATPFASTAHYSLLNALKLEGMTASDVELIDLQPDEILSAWETDDIGAAYIWYPTLGRLLESGKLITDSAQLEDKGIVTADLVVVRNEFAEKNPEVVKKFVELQLKANDIILEDSTKAAKEISSVLKISEQDAAKQITQFKYLKADEQIKYLNESMAKTLKDTADFLVEQKSIKFAPSLEDFTSKISSEYLQ